MDWISGALSAISNVGAAISKIASLFQQKRDQQAGAAMQQAADDQKALGNEQTAAQVQQTTAAEGTDQLRQDALKDAAG